METKAIKLQGRIYMPVSARVSHFRAAHPLGRIVTKLLDYSIEQGYAVCETTVYIENDVIVAVAQGSETRIDFKDYIEKAGTKSVGRAMAMAGYGTEECLDLEEGMGADGNMRIVDAGIAATVPAQQQQAPRYQYQQTTQIAKSRPQQATAVNNPSASQMPVNSRPQAQETTDPFADDERTFMPQDAAYFIEHCGLDEATAIKVFTIYIRTSNVEIDKINAMVDSRNANKKPVIMYLRDALKLAYKKDIDTALAAHGIHAGINSGSFEDLKAMINELV